MKKTPAKTKQRTTAVAVVPPASAESGILAVIERAARDPKVDVDKMERLLAMQKEVMATRAKTAFINAMKEAQEEIQPVARDAENKHTKSKYAKIETIDKEIRPIYSRHGFSLTYNSEQVGKQVKVMCDVMHIDGHVQRYELTGDLDTSGSQGTANKNLMQGLGSSVSYMRRYLACMIFNVVLKDEDDDGNTGGKKKEPEQDAFHKRVHGDNAKVVDAEVVIEDDGRDWDGKTIVVSGKATEGNYADPAGAARYLMGIIKNRKSKQSRVDLINQNLPLVRALVKTNQGGMVEEMHKLADKGE